MLTIKSITNGMASINIDVDGVIYPWTVGGLADVEDVPAHLDADANSYRADIRIALAMGRVLEPVVEPTLGEAIAVKSAAIQAEKCRVRDAGFAVDGVHFDSDQAARTAYLELALEIAANPAYSTPWKASEGVWVTMNAALFAQVKLAGTAHVQACFAWQAGLDAELTAIQASVSAGAMPEANAVAAVNSVSTGWSLS